MITELSDFLNQPLSVGEKTIQKRLVLAPMTMVGNVAFRELVSNFGGYGLLFTEMCSAKRIPHENRYISPYFRWRDAERDRLVCQIFGADPKIMATAAQRIEEEGFFGIDINFGCSVFSICRQNCGAQILKNPDLAVRIVAGIREAVSIPLFVKYRTGWQDDSQVAVELAKGFEDAGADALTFHPRVAPDRRNRPAKWSYIGLVKHSVSIPVFGNGDVFDSQDCWKMIQTTGCDGVAIGRLAIARPWTFALWAGGFKATPTIYLESALKLAQLVAGHYDSAAALKRFKRFALYFSANFRFGHTLFSRIQNLENMTAVEDILYHFFAESPELVSRPNLNFFI
ncbi:MAG: tRNA-dihydrouridine synthase family protein [Deltaproteobacteria bacterium]|nr:MAG: tRNA-dihydrouridine synthase family protein [Deltaproteobacteria bacterium]